MFRSLGDVDIALFCVSSKSSLSDTLSYIDIVLLTLSYTECSLCEPAGIAGGGGAGGTGDPTDVGFGLVGGGGEDPLTF